MKPEVIDSGPLEDIHGMAGDVSAAEMQSPPEGGEGLASQKSGLVRRCPCKHSDCAAFRGALQQIAGMDPAAQRADDLGRAARVARDALSALGVLGLAAQSLCAHTPMEEDKR